MSTKTTFKRIALVAVAALGLGVLTSVAPANADYTVTLGTPTVNAAVKDTTVTVSVPLTIAAGAVSGDTIAVSSTIVTKPSASSNSSMTAASSTTAITTFAGGTGTLTAGNANNSTTWTVSAANTTVAGSVTSKFTFVPDTAGVYTIAVFTDGDGKSAAASTIARSGAIKSTDTVKYISVTVVTDPATTVVLSQPVAGTGAVYDSTTATDGLVVKVSLKNAAGVVTRLSASQQVLVTIPTGLTLRKKQGATATGSLSVTASDYGLIDSDFDANGNAFLNFTGAAAATYTLSAVIGGTTATAVQLPLTFAAETAAVVGVAGAATYANANAVAAAAAPELGVSTGYVTGAQAAQVATTATSTDFIVYSASANVASKVLVEITDTNSLIWGSTTTTALVQDIVVTLADEAGASTATDGTAGKAYGTFTVAHSKLSKSASGVARGFAVSVESTDGTDPGTLVMAVTGVAAGIAATGSFQSLKPASTIRSLNGGTNTFTATYKDQYGAPVVGSAVTAYVSAGRNLQSTATALVTDATGTVSFTVTDAASTSTTLTDTVSFTGGAADKNATINYSTAITASTLTMSPVTTATTPSSSAIYTGTLASSTGAVSVTATVKDADGVAIAGVPVTLTLPAGLSLKSTTPAVAYTSSTGVASWSVYTTAAGTYKVTATGGGLTKDVYLKFTGGTARVVSVTAGTAANGVVPVTIKVADAYGNGVSSASVIVTGTGAGYFQGIALSSTQTTTADGTVVAAWIGSGTVTATISGGQSADGAALIGTTAVAGFPAGVGTASLAVDGGASSADAASDAAAEATDAANAATDAANAAAEAADAATAAAQDAADAVAALSTQVTEMVSALKKQITALTNLVIKIQKKVKA